MENRILFFLSLFFVLTLIISCDKGDDLQNDKPILYLAGRSFDGEIEKIAYWKNGVPKFIENTESSKLSSIKVKDNIVYMAGTDEGKSPFKAVMWKNGVFDKIINDAEVNNAVYFDFCGKDMHIICSQNFNKEFTYYKNNEKIETYQGWIGGVFALGNEFYACGLKNDINGNQYAFLWKNGNEIQLSQPIDTEDSWATSVFVLGNDVYVSGFISFSNSSKPMEAVYWKNGIRTILTSKGNAVASKIFVKGNDIYVSGYSSEIAGGTLHATYWKNGEKIVLDNSEKSSIINSIVVSKSGKVYALGNFLPGNSVLWVDGKVDETINGININKIDDMYLEEQ